MEVHNQIAKLNVLSVCSDDIKDNLHVHYTV